MAHEIDWLRGKLQVTQTEVMIVTPAEAAEAECEAGTYNIVREAFAGTIPYRMARALSGVALVKTDAVSEVLHLGTGYRGGEGRCRFYRTTYTREVAA